MADFTLSPGIVTSEIDRSIRQPTVSVGSVGGVVGRFDWGPALTPIFVEGVTDLINKFGEPTTANYVEWYNAYNFLQYGDELNVVRIIENTTTKNATFAGVGNDLLVENDSVYMNYLIEEEGGFKDSSASGSEPKFGADTQYGPWFAKYPGDLGNSITVDMCIANVPSKTVSANTVLFPDPTNDQVHGVEMTQVSDNLFNVQFYNESTGSKVPVDFMNGSLGYFEDNLDAISQEKVVSFVNPDSTSDEYNMLIVNYNSGTKTLQAYVNLGGSTSPAAATDLKFVNPLVSLTIKERSKYKEFSYGAKSNSPNNLFGLVWFNNNTDRIYGINTVFTKQVSVGDNLFVAGQRLSVSEVISNTELRLGASIIGRAINTTPVPWAREWTYATLFNDAPKTSSDARAVNKNQTGNYNDQLHIVVIDAGGKITGTTNSILESYAFLSVARDGRDDFGAPTYYVTRVNNNSDWIKWACHPLDAAAMSNNWGELTEGNVFTTFHKTAVAGVADYTKSRFSNGSSGNPIDDDDILRAIDAFKAKEEVDVDFLITGWTYTPGNFIDYRLAISKMIQVAESRGDCVVCVSADYGQTVRGYSDEDDITAQFISWREGVYNSNYAFMDGNFKYQYDSFNDTYRWLPLSGDIAGLMAQTDKNQFPWFSPAGYSRGQIKNVVKLAWNPSQSARDDLYVNQINPIISIRGEGTLLFGDKTLQRVASAFDRINVRRLFISMKDFVVVQARRKLFEFNTPATRADFKRICEQYLETIITNQGISEYRVICDETNNTADVIEQNRFIADIYVRPNYTINFIKLNFIAVGQTVDFDDLIG